MSLFSVFQPSLGNASPGIEILPLFFCCLDVKRVSIVGLISHNYVGIRLVQKINFGANLMNGIYPNLFKKQGWKRSD